MHLILPMGVDEILKLDIREQIIDIPAQSIITAEGMSIRVDGVVYYRINAAEKAMLGVKDVNKNVSLLSQTKLREVLGTKTFNELQSDREVIANQLQVDMDLATDPWGVKVSRVELTDVVIPQEMKMAMATAAQSEREAKARLIDSNSAAKAQLVRAEAEAQTVLIRADAASKATVTTAEGEARAAKLTADAARALANTPGAMQLRFMQTLTDISRSPGSTTFLPFSTDMMPALANVGTAAALGKMMK